MTEREPTGDPSLRDLFFSTEPTNWNETSFSDEEVRCQMDRFTRANDILTSHLKALGQATAGTFVDFGNGVVFTRDKDRLRISIERSVVDEEGTGGVTFVYNPETNVVVQRELGVTSNCHLEAFVVTHHQAAQAFAQPQFKGWEHAAVTDYYVDILHAAKVGTFPPGVEYPGTNLTPDADVPHVRLPFNDADLHVMGQSYRALFQEWLHMEVPNLDQP